MNAIMMAAMRDPIDVSTSRRIGLQVVLAVGLFAITAALFWPARHFEFVGYDDPLYVTANETVQRGLTLEGVRYAFTTGHAANWHPVTWLSHMLDCQLSAHEITKDGKSIREFDPRVHHTHNILLHALNAALLLLVLCSLFRGNIVACTFVAAFFALHPLRIESVAWIAERKDLLSGLFGLLSVWSYIFFARKSTWWWYLLLIAFYSLSLMSKPMLVTLPLILLLLDYWPLRRILRSPTSFTHVELNRSLAPPEAHATLARVIIEKLPLLAISLASSVITIIVQSAGGAIDTTDKASLATRLVNAAVAYMRYLGKTFWPTDLAVFYPQHVWPSEIIVVSVCGLLAITILAITLARRLPSLFVGWLWFAGSLVPVIGLIQVGAQSMADRYTYFPHIGLFVALVFAAMGIFGRDRAIVLIIAGLGFLGALGYETRNALRFWHDSESLYRHGIQVTHDNWILHTNLGALLKSRGELSEADEHFKEAFKIKPDNAETQYHMADVLLRAGDVRQAISSLNRAIELDPQFDLALNDLAWLLATQADPTLRNPAHALELAKRACEVQSPDAALLDTLAAAYASNGQFDNAIATAEKALAMANDANQTQLASVIQLHLARFRAGQPIREGRP
jgi:tetratricopeptide (TPR) repeat protein